MEVGNKTTDWIWYFFPQPPHPLATSSNSIKYSLKNKKEVLQYIDNDILRERYITLINALIKYKTDNPTKDLLTIMGKQIDKVKFISSITLFYEVANEKYNYINKLGFVPEDMPPNLKIQSESLEMVIKTVQRCKEVFTDIEFDNNIIMLLTDTDEQQYFKIEDTYEGYGESASGASASGGLFGGQMKNTPSSHSSDSSDSFDSFKHADMSKVTNIEHLHNLVGGTISNDVLQIALKNNDNNVYRSLASLTNQKTLGIYKMLVNNKKI